MLQTTVNLELGFGRIGPWQAFDEMHSIATVY
jgi:hypothetical protein